MARSFVAQDAEFVLRFDTDASPYHQDVHTGTPAFVRVSHFVITTSTSAVTLCRDGACTQR